VILLAVINADGRATQVRVFKSLKPGLDEGAIEAVLIDMIVATLTESLSTLPKGFRLLAGSTISSTFRKSCTCSSLSG
jgi:hypothetical protein